MKEIDWYWAWSNQEKRAGDCHKTLKGVIWYVKGHVEFTRKSWGNIRLKYLNGIRVWKWN